MDNHDKRKEKESAGRDQRAKPDSKVAAEAEQKGAQHHDEQPDGNVATGKPAAFPPHN